MCIQLTCVLSLPSFILPVWRVWRVWRVALHTGARVRYAVARAGEGPIRVGWRIARYEPALASETGRREAAEVVRRGRGRGGDGGVAGCAGGVVGVFVMY